MNREEIVISKHIFETSVRGLMKKVDMLDDTELERCIARILDNYSDQNSNIKVSLLQVC